VAREEEEVAPADHAVACCRGGGHGRTPDLTSRRGAHRISRRDDEEVVAGCRIPRRGAGPTAAADEACPGPNPTAAAPRGGEKEEDATRVEELDAGEELESFFAHSSRR
jgi:hypothetical protein